MSKSLPEHFGLKKAVISILGPSKAGKTTFTRYLETGHPILESPNTTLGSDYRSKGVKIKNWELTLIDVGGQKKFQDLFWDIAVQRSNAVIFMLDATIRPETDKLKFSDQIEQLNYTFEIMNDDTVLLILLNKQDLKNRSPLQPIDFLKYVKSDRMQKTTTGLLTTSAKFGEGVVDALSWLIEMTEENSK